MLQAMYNGVSGIQAQQESMDVIGNNIANVNTTGYKAGRVTFEDQLSQTIQGASKGDGKTIGGTNPTQTGLGVKIAAIDTLMEQGGLQSTSQPTDMAIQGNGYFMLGDASGVKYTRDGSFALDSNGNLVNSANGSYVLGWKADSTGAVDTSKQIDSSSHLAIPVGGLTAVSPTTNVSYTGNLSAESTSATAAYTRSVKVYDTLGSPQTLTLGFTPTTTANTWKWTASGDASAGGSGTITFDSSGKVTGQTGSISMSPADGSTTPQSITPDFSQVTQLAGSSSAAPVSQDGFGPGTLQSFTVDEQGLITGVFNNGLTRPLGQVALADFSNPGGMERAGSNAFNATINSGTPQVGTATQAGMGQLSTGYLEQSNVDLSTEFTNMIVTQRGFQANTKIVTTVDQLLNDVINMKQ